MDRKKQIIKFLADRSKRTLVDMKHEPDRLHELLGLYLTHLPDIHVGMGIRSPVRWKCSQWLQLMLDNAAMPCQHCISAGDCDGACSSAYLGFLESFCAICTETDREHCQAWAKNEITRQKKPQGISRKGEKFNYTFAAVIKSDIGIQLQSMLASFLIPEHVSINKPGTLPSWEKVAKRAEEFLTDWGVKATRSDATPGRAHIEVALAIISLHLAFFGDFLGRTVFSQMASSIGHEDFCSAAVIGAYILKQKGYPEDEIRRRVNTEYNPEERLVGNIKQESSIMNFDSTEILKLLDGIQSLYNSRFVPDLKMGDISDAYQAALDNWVEKGELIRHPLIISDSSVHIAPDFDHKYVLYIAYTRLAALVSAFPGLRLSAKSSTLFDGDLLLRLRIILRAQRISNLGRRISNPFNFKEACKQVGATYTTVRDAIYDYKEENPAYKRVKAMYGEKVNLRAYLVAESTEQEIRQWLENVAIKAI